MLCEYTQYTILIALPYLIGGQNPEHQQESSCCTQEILDCLWLVAYDLNDSKICFFFSDLMVLSGKQNMIKKLWLTLHKATTMFRFSFA